MTLTNYWWLLIWLFVGGAIMAQFPKRQERLDGKIVERWYYLPAILLVVPYIIWAGYRTDNYGDTWVYRETFLELSDGLAQIPEYFTDEADDPGFGVFMTLMKMILGNQDELFFLVIATIQMLCLALTFRKFSSDYWTSIFLFIVSTDYISWMHNGMRQFIAVALIFACMDLIVKKKYVPLILIILLASTIHASALLMVPVVFIVQGKAWNYRTVLVLVVAMVGVAFIDRFTPVLGELLQDTQYDDVMTNGIWEQDDGTNILRVAVYSVPAILSVVGLRYIRAADDPLINVCVNCSIVTMALYAVSAVSSGIYIGRLPIYTTLMGYIALPWMIKHMFTDQSARIVKSVMIIAYLVFFYYQMHFTWGLI